MKFRKFHLQSWLDNLNGVRESLQYAPPAFKEYPRYPRVALLKPRRAQRPFSDTLELRNSAESFSSKAFPLALLGDILHDGAGLNEARRERNGRHHPSGGALYPLEYYVAPFRVESLIQHYYHYAPQAHALEEMIAQPPVQAFAHESFALPPNMDPAAMIIITAVWGRNFPKYGEFAYRLALLEAGHAAQNILLSAAARGAKARPVGATGEKTPQLLGIEREDEDAVYLILLGC